MNPRLKLWSVSALLYVLFVAWYTDFDGPLEQDEISRFLKQMEARGGTTPEMLEKAYRAALSILGRDPSAAPSHLFLGGIGLGARVTARLATARLQIDGVFLLGYPLHPADRPDQVQAEDLRFLNSLSQIITDSDLRSDLIKRSGRSGRAFLTEFRKEGAKATAGDKTLVVTNLESYALSGHVGALTLTSFNSFLKNFYKLQRATPPSSRKSEPAIFEMIKMVAIKDPEYRKEFKQELAIQKPASATALTTLVREMLRSD